VRERAKDMDGWRWTHVEHVDTIVVARLHELLDDVALLGTADAVQDVSPVLTNQGQLFQGGTVGGVCSLT
jgi:hypothetical protein